MDRSKLGILIMFGSVVLFFVALFAGRALIAREQISAVQAFGAELPQELRVFSIFRTDGGYIGEFSLPSPPHMLRLLRDTSSLPESKFEVGDLLVKDRGTNVSPFFHSYLGAHIDRRRIQQVEQVAIDIGGREFPALTFMEKSSNYHLLALVDLRDGAQESAGGLCVLLVSRKDTRVEILEVGGVLRGLGCEG